MRKGISQQVFRNVLFELLHRPLNLLKYYYELRHFFLNFSYDDDSDIILCCVLGYVHDLLKIWEVNIGCLAFGIDLCQGATGLA